MRYGDTGPQPSPASRRGHDARLLFRDLRFADNPSGPAGRSVTRPFARETRVTDSTAAKVTGAYQRNAHLAARRADAALAAMRDTQSSPEHKCPGKLDMNARIHA